MELRDLRYFCITVETERVTKAAERLGISQPSLTRILNQIEEEVGGKLMERSGRRISLTPGGEIFYKYAQKVLNDIDILLTEMDYIFDRKERTITLLCNTESFATWLIMEFKKVDPRYAISVLHASKQEMLEALNSGGADFALCCPPISVKNSAILATDIAFFEEGLILLPPGHPLLRKKSVTIDELRDEPLVTTQKHSGMRNMLEPIFERAKFHPHIICESNNLDMVIQAVMGGLGYAFITKLMVIDRPELMNNCVEIDVPGNIGFFGLSYQKDSLENRNCAHFHDFVTASLRELETQLYGEEAIKRLEDCKI